MAEGTGYKRYDRLFVGLDVGSTTVKAVVVDPVTDEILWSDYQRHETKQPEKVLEFLTRIETDFPVDHDRIRIFITGSGGGGIAARIGAKFVQEVNAVSLAVEKLYPEAGSVIELGGQDAKIIIFKEDPETGKKKKIPSMNDKCAGGTGAVIDKINAKLRIPADELKDMGYTGIKIHPVAGKCGVFAETDVNSLQKMGVPADQLMASLFDAIIGQNLSVLTRGNTLLPHVLLLGGPNTYIRGMVEAWKENIPKIWEERKTPLPEGVDPQDLIRVPDNAQYFAAIGAVEFGKEEEEAIGVYRGTKLLRHYIEVGRLEEKQASGSRGLWDTKQELEAFVEKHTIPPFTPATFSPGQHVRGFIGLDGGSTSTKAALLDEDRNVLVKAYQLSKGNPIEDTKEILASIKQQVEDAGATLEVMGIGTTGYAKDILKDVLRADVALVETVAHTESAIRFFGDDVDIIVDVGGQDIKLIVLKNRQVKDFKLNTQCSAGNGYFLQSTAETFGFDVRKYAEIAFGAEAMPTFGYGCAVFMQSDIVDFQRQGWKPEEIMAGLAAVLPKNIWLYVAQLPNLAALGTNFVLQGGTQHNLAAVKSQVDFIEQRFAGKDVSPTITVHPHCGESGAIGAGIEAVRLYENGHRTEFIGIERVQEITYTSHRSEDTRCYFCKNRCLRTFIDVNVGDEYADEPRPSKIEILPGVKRLIVGNSCERGLVEDVDAMRVIKKDMDSNKEQFPNFLEISAETVFRSPRAQVVADPADKRAFTAAARARNAAAAKRDELRIGIPKVLNAYSTNPLFAGWLEALGVNPPNIVYSDFTSEELYKEGAKRGAIDPCFPSKIGIPHVHNLLYKHHANSRKPLDVIFFPMIDSLGTHLSCTQSSRACPTVTATPEAVKAAFTKEGDLFAEMGVVYKNTFVNIDEPRLLEKQLFDDWKDLLGLTQEEHRRAVDEGYRCLEKWEGEVRGAAREVLDQLEAEDRLGIVLLGRPYHNDPGVNHEICDEFQRIGYPVFTQDSLPVDEDLMWRMFGDDVRAGRIQDPFDVSDVWKNSYSENTTRKIWASKYTARHPNLVALELSSFKCGHDAPIYTVVEEIVQDAGTPYFCFKDIDENKASGSIKIRVETIGYFLQRYREDMVREKGKRAQIEARLAELERQLRAEAARGGGHTAGVRQ
ncbi:MAG: CoA activase [Thermoleophilia bacterium]|nr:CoA activase [Thermoleophilia bacterium]